MPTESHTELQGEISACTVCAEHLPLGPRPVVSFAPSAQILIVGQAPGTKVHASGVPWDDASGKRLREWMDVDEDSFYDSEIMAIVPMGFCYPGKGKSGDLAPRKECAPLWHGRILDTLPELRLTLLIGNYAQQYYLPDSPYRTLTDRVRNTADFLPQFFCLPHPSPRNNIWLRKNPWFEKEVIPLLRQQIFTVRHSES